MKKQIAIFMLFILNNYISDDSLQDLTPIGRFLITPAYYVHNFIIYLLSFLFLPIVLIHIKYEQEIIYTINEMLNFVEEILEIHKK